MSLEKKSMDALHELQNEDDDSDSSYEQPANNFELPSDSGRIGCHFPNKGTTGRVERFHLDFKSVLGIACMYTILFVGVALGTMSQLSTFAFQQQTFHRYNSRTSFITKNASNHV